MIATRADPLVDTPDAARPLRGIRILSIEQYGAGPFATLVLADLGAEVIKIEQPGTGDPMREWGREKPHGKSLWWPVVGRNKKSVTLDLRTPEGQRIARDRRQHHRVGGGVEGERDEAIGIDLRRKDRMRPGLRCSDADKAGAGAEIEQPAAAHPFRVVAEVMRQYQSTSPRPGPVGRAAAGFEAPQARSRMCRVQDDVRQPRHRPQQQVAADEVFYPVTGC